jgi:hypothetical protein
MKSRLLPSCRTLDVEVGHELLMKPMSSGRDDPRSWSHEQRCVASLLSWLRSYVVAVESVKETVLCTIQYTRNLQSDLRTKATQAIQKIYVS